MIVIKISDVRRHLEYYQYLEEEEEFYRLEAERAAREQEQYLHGNKAEVNNRQQTQQSDELKQAADEATKAAQEAAKAAAEASQGLLKGISSFGGNLMEQSGGFGFGFGGGKEKKASTGFSLGGFGLASLGAPPQAQKKAQTVPQPQAQPPKAAPAEMLTPAADAYLKPFTGRMTARERWWWAYRMTVQVKLTVLFSLVRFCKVFCAFLNLLLF